MLLPRCLVCKCVLEGSREKQWQRCFCFAGELFAEDASWCSGRLPVTWNVRSLYCAIVARKCVMVVEQCHTLQPRCTYCLGLYELCCRRGKVWPGEKHLCRSTTLGPCCREEHIIYITRVTTLPRFITAPPTFLAVRAHMPLPPPRLGPGGIVCSGVVTSKSLLRGHYLLRTKHIYSNQEQSPRSAFVLLCCACTFPSFT